MCAGQFRKIPPPSAGGGPKRHIRASVQSFGSRRSPQIRNVGIHACRQSQRIGALLPRFLGLRPWWWVAPCYHDQRGFAPAAMFHAPPDTAGGLSRPGLFPNSKDRPSGNLEGAPPRRAKTSIMAARVSRASRADEKGKRSTPEISVDGHFHWRSTVSNLLHRVFCARTIPGIPISLWK